MDHQGLKVYRVYVNDDLGLTLTYMYFTASTSLVKFAYCAYTRPIYRTIGPMVYIISISFFSRAKRLLVLSPGPALFDYILYNFIGFVTMRRNDFDNLIS